MVNLLQSPSGKLLRVKITESSGNIAFDRSVEKAVLAASPIPLPEDPTIFDREITLLFRPRY